MRMPGVKKPRLCRIAIHSEIKEIGTNLTASGARYKRNSFEAGFGNLLDSIVPSVAATVKTVGCALAHCPRIGRSAARRNQIVAEE